MFPLTENETDPEFHPVQINKIINKFKQIITSAADKAFGVPRQQNIRKRPVSYWSEECKIVIK